MTALAEMRRAVEQQERKVNELLPKAEAAQEAALASLSIEIPDGTDEQTARDMRAAEALRRPDAFADIDAAWKEHSTARDELGVMQANLLKLEQASGSLPGASPSSDYREMEHQARLAERSARASRAELMRRFAAQPEIARAREFFAQTGRTGAVELGQFANVEETMALLNLNSMHDFAIANVIEGLPSTEAGAFVVPDRQGYLSLLHQSPRLTGMVGSGTTDSDTIEWVEQTLYTNAAAAVAEDASLAQSTMTWAVRNALVEERGHFMQATRRALADVGQLRTLIETEMTSGLSRSIETGILTDNGTSPQWRGLKNTTGIIEQDKVATEQSLDTIHKAMTKIRIQYGEPDGIAMHPSTYEKLRLARLSYGTGSIGPYELGDAGGGVPTIWGFPPVQTTDIVVDDIWVADFANATRLAIREGISLLATNAHASTFTARIITIIATMRGVFYTQRAKHVALVDLSP